MDLTQIQLYQTFKHFRNLFKYKRMLFQVVWIDLRIQNVSNILGMLWIALYPLLFLAVYAAVYVVILKVKLQVFTPIDYVLLIFCGLIPFLGMAEALASGTGSIIANKGLITNTIFPIELIPVKTVLLSQVTVIIGFALLIIGTIATNRISYTIFLLPLVWVLFITFLLGIVWILSIIAVYFRDIQRIIPILILILMLLSPIAYTIEMVPQNLRLVCYLNPLAYFIWSFQSIIVLGELPRTEHIIGIIILGLGSLWLGFHLFMRAKQIMIESI